ncbi:Hcp family type VI secretion system effector [Paraburkholderia sp. ZP32-5]|uniref:Hcp family type VI secretion system effector n=1 Tax=Paraburkholderia sp. ZP32-5 TaxID=2883245 RepID=UPI001F3C4F71|nr:type VI secretion system tube protein Hcp [Paraburkholderia sp. ZP32-5]
MSNIFIKINGVTGESQNAAHPDEIEVLSWNWAITQPSSLHSGSGGGAAKASASALHFMHSIDRASPILAGQCFQGKHIPEAVLTMSKANGTNFDYLRITMNDVIISHVESAAGGGLALEHVALSFARMKKEYVLQRATGRSQGTVTAIVDLKQNPIA